LEICLSFEDYVSCDNDASVRSNDGWKVYMHCCIVSVEDGENGVESKNPAIYLSAHQGKGGGGTDNEEKPLWNLMSVVTHWVPSAVVRTRCTGFSRERRSSNLTFIVWPLSCRVVANGQSYFHS
jgi:hypothetical protein